MEIIYEMKKFIFHSYVYNRLLFFKVRQSVFKFLLSESSNLPILSIQNNFSKMSKILNTAGLMWEDTVNFPVFLNNIEEGQLR